MRISVIDIGTNTLLLLVADVRADGGIAPVHHGHVIGRLGKGVDEHRIILPETFSRMADLLGDFVRVSGELKSERIIACGTSALRDARNANEFLSFIKTKLGFEIRILSGEEEAELTYRGAVSEFLESPAESFAVLDIGGGSTELTVGHGLDITSKQSLNIGCVRLTERVLKTIPPSHQALDQAVSEIRRQLSTTAPLSSPTRLIGVAGTVTTLAAIDLNLPEYDPLKVSGHILTWDFIETILAEFRAKSVEEMRAYPQILPGRADILLAGTVILREAMNRLGAREITVSDRGLRYGVALDEAKRSGG